MLFFLDCFVIIVVVRIVVSVAMIIVSVSVSVCSGVFGTVIFPPTFMGCPDRTNTA